MKPFFVYLLRCGDGSYYCGHTDNIELRLYQHETGNIGYTAKRKPITLVWQAEFEKREDALTFERQIKGWSRVKKEALIAGDWVAVSALAKSKVGSAIRSSTSSDRTEIKSSGRTVYGG